MVRPENLAQACVFCSKTSGVVRKFDKSSWSLLRKVAISRSEENLAGSIAEITKKIIVLSEPDYSIEGYHGACHRKYITLKSSNRKRNISENMTEEGNGEYLPSTSNTMVGFQKASVTKIFCNKR